MKFVSRSNAPRDACTCSIRALCAINTYALNACAYRARVECE